MGALADDLVFRGLVHQMTDPGLMKRLDEGGLTVYAGFDPTAPSLHVGSLLPLCTLRRLQRGGHRPIALAGGGTGLIGDPGGKAGERALQSREELAANLDGIQPQLTRFLDFSAAAGGQRALLLDNGTWLNQLRLLDFLRDVGKHFTVNQMVAKESVRSRLDRPEQGISYTEFSYMLLQAYDFLRLHMDHGCDLQLGGSDQWGNITMGVELVRKLCQEEVFGLTTPLVVKADGTKFGKTESGTVWLDAARTSPYRLYQFFLNVEDAMVGAYLRYFTDLSQEEILALDAETEARPGLRSAQRALAGEVCALVHGGDERARAERAAAVLFGEQGADLRSLEESLLLEVVEDAPSSTVPRERLLEGVPLVDVLASAKVAGSKSEARRLIAQGGLSINGVRVDDSDRVLGPADLLHDRYVIVRRGRRQYHVLVVG